MKRRMDNIVRLLYEYEQGAPLPPAPAPVKTAHDEATAYTDETPMPFGKWKGTPLGKLRSDYRAWLASQDNLSDKRLHAYLHNNETEETCIDRT